MKVTDNIVVSNFITKSNKKRSDVTASVGKYPNLAQAWAKRLEIEFDLRFFLNRIRRDIEIEGDRNVLQIASNFQTQFGIKYMCKDGHFQMRELGGPDVKMKRYGDRLITAGFYSGRRQSAIGAGEAKRQVKSRAQ